jgi:hypothetical protein
VLTWEAQEHRQLGQGVQQAGDRGRVAVLVAVGEGVGASAGLSDRLVAGIGGDVVEDLPERRLDLGLGVVGDLGQDVAGTVDQAALPQRARERPLDRADQPGRAIGDDQQRRTSPRPLRSSRNPAQGSMPSSLPGASPSSTGPPVVLTPHATRTGSAGAPG